MDRWLDTGKAPEQIEAVKRLDGRVVRKRPICANPRYAAYKGSGEIEDSASFECRLP
jgi:feruloyl esterase